MGLRVGVVGAGAMGALHARVVSDDADASLVWVADPDQGIRDNVASRYGTEAIVTPSSFRDVDAVIIASPTHTHVPLCLEAISAGKPFLVEKPLAPDIDEVEVVLKAAAAGGVPFTVGFVERFNPAVRTVKSIVDDPFYVTATRHSPYVDRIKTGVGGDLMIHDLDLSLRLMNAAPTSATASYVQVHPSSEPGAEDIAEATIAFENGGVASLSANRAAQRKIRTLSVANLDMTAEVDLMRQDITIYRHVLSAPIREDRAGYRQETVMEIPQLRFRAEPLVAQFAHFVDLISGTVDPLDEAEGIRLPHLALASCRRSATGGAAEAIDGR